MANEKILNTRIVLKNDTYEAWGKSSLILKKGEIALASIETQDPVTGTYDVPTYLIKVGDGVNAFNKLNWLAASASDVYDWAKQKELPVETVGKGNGVASITWDALQNKILVTAANFDTAGAASTAETNAKQHATGLNTAMDERVKKLETASGDGVGSLGAKIKAVNDRIDNLTLAEQNCEVGYVFDTITQTNGQVSVTTRQLTAADISDLKSVVDGYGYAKNSDLTTHISNKENPHGVTAEQVGLGNVENKSSATLKSDFTGSIASTNQGFVKGGDVFTALATKPDATSLTVKDTAVATELVSAVSEKNGKITVSRRKLVNADIPSIPASKISDFDAEVTNNTTVSGLSTTVGNSGSGLVKKVADLESKIGGVTGAMHFIGAGATLPKEGTDGDVYLITAGENAGKEYVYNAGGWVELGDTTKEGKRIATLETFKKTVEGNGTGSINKALADAKAYTDALASGAVKTNTTDIANLKKNLSDGTTVAKKADEATKATQDSAGNTITTFYEKKSDANLVRGRLDVIEGSGEGSVSKALTDAKAYTDDEIGKIHKFTNQTVLDGISSEKVQAWDGEVGAMAKVNALGTAAKKNVEFFATSAQGKKADSALQTISTTENQGLKVTNKNQIDIDDTITFVFDCGTSTEGQASLSAV